MKEYLENYIQHINKAQINICSFTKNMKIVEYI